MKTPRKEGPRPGEVARPARRFRFHHTADLRHENSQIRREP